MVLYKFDGNNTCLFPSGMGYLVYMSDTATTSKPVHIMVSNVYMRRPGIADLVRNNGVRYKAQWVLLGSESVIVESDIVYTSSSKLTKEEAIALAHAWLAKHPQYTETK